jgi:hypothetical protein
MAVRLANWVGMAIQGGEEDSVESETRGVAEGREKACRVIPRQQTETKLKEEMRKTQQAGLEDAIAGRVKLSVSDCTMEGKRTSTPQGILRLLSC